MAAGPQRRPEPVKHLGPHIVPLERALRERADSLAANWADMQATIALHGIPQREANSIGYALALILAAELRALADELHHW